MPLSINRKVKKLSRIQEEDIMEKIGGHRQAGSGARPGYKGDGRLYDKARIEAKYTTAKSYKINYSDLSKIRGQCQGNERPALVLDFKDPMTGRTMDRWVIIPFSDWEKYVKEGQIDEPTNY